MPECADTRSVHEDITMSTRMTSKKVVFRHPFVLGGFAYVAPAGSYLVETEEEQIGDLSAWRQTATVIHIERDDDLFFVKIDADDLAKAVVRDAGPAETIETLTARLDPQRRKTRPIRRKKF
jgi:hypothetical protein